MNLTGVDPLQINIKTKNFIFSKTDVNIFSNFISHEVILCDAKDPPWFNGKIKSLINKKHKTYSSYHKNKVNNQIRENLSSSQQRLSDMVDDLKQK